MASHWRSLLLFFGGGDSQATHLRRYLVITGHHPSGAKATYEVAPFHPKPSNCLPEQLPYLFIVVTDVVYIY